MGFFNKLKRAIIGEEEPKQELQEEIQETLEQEEEITSEVLETVEPTEPTEPTELVEQVSEVATDSAATPEAVAEAEQAVVEVEKEVEEVTETLTVIQEETTTVVEEVPLVEVEPVVAEVEVVELEPVVEEVAPAAKMDKGLKKSRRTFGQMFNQLMANFRSVDEDFFEELEETLITADVGFETAIKITEDLRQEVKLQNAKKKEDVQRLIVEKLVETYEAAGVDENNDLNLKKDGLTVMLFVGVNGVGKTTSIGKLANQYREAGKKVILAAADTFRAGAIDQLVVWGERAQVEVVRGNAGGDPAAVVYDGIEKAKEKNADILLVDTAGRLQNKVNLMKELEKIKRVIQREIPDGPHEVLLVVDATTGQNAMVQAKQFKETTDVTGLVLSKLDGTAKGGIVLAIRSELNLPVKLVGLGEGINDLQPFVPKDFVHGLFKELLA